MQAVRGVTGRSAGGSVPIAVTDARACHAAHDKRTTNRVWPDSACGESRDRVRRRPPEAAIAKTHRVGMQPRPSLPYRVLVVHAAGGEAVQHVQHLSQDRRRRVALCGRLKRQVKNRTNVVDTFANPRLCSAQGAVLVETHRDAQGRKVPDGHLRDGSMALLARSDNGTGRWRSRP